MLLPVLSATHTGAGWCPGAPFPKQLPAKGLGKAEHGLSVWALATCVGDAEEVLGFWFQSGQSPSLWPSEKGMIGWMVSLIFLISKISNLEK